ncbi:Putative methyltransferase [Magnetospirillum sp. XM-1]|uniref:class I SAM-dependent methyltransferase n=1 Tax=Magnetospirillum sp. XM-1 TaxID=1663591 RepID=UPI00073E0366|nr:class I SAM-dependent methyltransferase [Magnetospirillum sp. XM-1]CUW38015.1 Putative methyltransferase [Magnetospirillum sp. XM-1]
MSKGLYVSEELERHIDELFDSTIVEMGPRFSSNIVEDPKRLGFVLARYKFCSKMLAGKERVLEIGCGEGFALPVVADTVGHVTAIDMEPRLIEGCRRRLRFLKNVDFLTVDFASSYVAEQKFDAAYSMDVFEHVRPELESVYLDNLVNNLKDDGVAIIGVPNITAEKYASESSRMGHINLKDSGALVATMSRYFENVFLFGMNDETLHTGYSPMAHYLIVLCAGKKARAIR